MTDQAIKEFPESKAIANVLAMHEKLMLYGIRRSSQLQDFDR
jgi:hypothetical protein